MVIPHSGGYSHAKFEGNLLLFKFGPHTKSGLTIPQCGRPLLTTLLNPSIEAMAFKYPLIYLQISQLENMHNSIVPDRADCLKSVLGMLGTEWMRQRDQHARQ